MFLSYYMMRLLLCVSIVGLASCGKADPLNRGATVTGSVTIDGKALAGGVVVFESVDGKFNPQSTIRLDGTYIIQEPPIGSCKISVKTSHLASFAPPLTLKGKVSQKQFPGFNEEEVGYFTPIPNKYESSATSGLSIEIKSGNMTYDIPLVSK
jgi:hypothetical protein